MRMIICWELEKSEKEVVVTYFDIYMEVLRLSKN